MKIKIWGARGSIPSPLKPDEVKAKIYQAVLGAASINLNNPDAVKSYVDSLPPLLAGTAGGNTTCVEVQADNHTFIVDAGSGIRELGLELMKGPCGRGEGELHLFFSHAHWDHIQGFPFFVPAFIPGNKIYIYSIHELEEVLIEQQKFRNFPVPVSYMQATREFIKIKPGEPFRVGDVRINTIRTVHPGDAYAFRFDDEYSTFVFASDAEYKNLNHDHMQPYIDFFSNADALIFDAQFTLGEAFQKVDWGHSSAMIGADMARTAGVKKLILFHHDPTYSDDTLRDIQKKTVEYQAQNTNLPTCEVIVAYEGLTIDLAPAGSVMVELVSENDTAIITPSSIFDERGVGRLELQLARLKEMNISNGSIIDLSEVETLSSASLKALIILRREHDKTDIVLASPSSHIRQVIELAGFADYFAIYPSVEAAVEALKVKEALNLPGQLINDRYQIEEKLHDGHLGAVLRGTDLVKSETIVIKILSPSLSQKVTDRLLRQAKQFIHFRHHNMVDVFDYGQGPEFSFIVEEYASGDNLHAFIQQTQDINTPLNLNIALDIGLQIAQVLEYSHSKGKIHGYLQPKNIILIDGDTPQGTPKEFEYIIKVKRFGMIWLDEGVNLLDRPLPLVSAHYFAPEQILGHPIDARTDLYAFGVILYEMFTGHRPFNGNDDRAIMEGHLYQTPKPLREFNPKLSNALEHFILKLLSKNPNERYTNALQAYQVLKSVGVYRSNQSEGPTSTVPRLRQLVGRDQELQQLLGAWQKTRTEQGQILFITGETGIGKTRLVQELVRYVDAGVVLMGSCEEREEVAAYKPFIEILQAYFATIPPEVIDQQGYSQLLSELTRLVPEINTLVPDLPPPKPLEPRQEQLRVMMTTAQFITEATKVRPWLLIVEDIHWMDESSFQMLMHLARYTSTLQLMIVGTYRDTDLDINHPLLNVLRGLRHQPGYKTIHLKRLNQGEVGQLLTNILGLQLSSMVGLKNIPSAVIEQIYQHTEGNPVYVEEVVSGLIDEGLITKNHQGWDFSQLAEISLPQSVRDAVLNRIRHLNLDTQRLLRQASILGRTFKFDDLQAMSGLSEWEVLERMDVALERQLVHEVFGENMLSFNHAEIQQVLYEDMSPLRRRALHLQAGKAIEERTQPDPITGLKSERIVEQLAFHYGKAGKFERAIVYSVEAARLAEAKYANQTALSWYQRVIEMLDQLGLDQAKDLRTFALTAYEATGKLLIILGRYQDALAHYEAARQLVEKDNQIVESARRVADISRKTARIYKKQGRFGEALVSIDYALGCLNPEEVTIELANTYLLRAEIYNHQGKLTQSVEWAEKGLTIATQLHHREGQQTQGWAYYLLGSNYNTLGQFSRAIEACQQSIEIYEQLAYLAGLSRAYIYLAEVYINQSNWQQATAMLNKSLVAKEEIGDIFDQANIFHNQAKIQYYQGDYDQARLLYDKTLMIWQQVGGAFFEAMVLIDIAQLLLTQQQWTQTEIYLRQAEAIIKKINSTKLTPQLYRIWADLYLQNNQLTQSLKYISQAVNLAVTQNQVLQQAVALRILGQIQQKRGDIEQASAVLQNSLQLLTDISCDYELAQVMVVLAGFNQSSETANHLNNALEIFDRLGVKSDLVTTLQAKEG